MKNEWLIKFGGFSELRAFGRVVLFKHWSTFSNPFFTHTHTHALSEEVWGYLLISVQFTQSCPTVCDPMNCSTPGFPIHHQLPKLAQTHVHWVSDAIQPSHPLLSPFPPAFNLSQHRGLFQWVSSSHQVTEVLELQHQQQSFQYSVLISFRIDWLDLLAIQGTLKSLL